MRLPSFDPTRPQPLERLAVETGLREFGRVLFSRMDCESTSRRLTIWIGMNGYSLRKESSAGEYEFLDHDTVYSSEGDVTSGHNRLLDIHCRELCRAED